MPSRLLLSLCWREPCYPLCYRHQHVSSHSVSESCRVWPSLSIRFACLLVSTPWDFFACHPLFEYGSFVVSEQDWNCLTFRRRYSPWTESPWLSVGQSCVGSQSSRPQNRSLKTNFGAYQCLSFRFLLAAAQAWTCLALSLARCTWTSSLLLAQLRCAFPSCLSRWAGLVRPFFRPEVWHWRHIRQGLSYLAFPRSFPPEDAALEERCWGQMDCRSWHFDVFFASLSDCSCSSTSSQTRLRMTVWQLSCWSFCVLVPLPRWSVNLFWISMAGSCH